MANIGGGLGGAIGIAAESVYGTWVSSSTWLEVHAAKLQERPHLVQGTGLAYSRTVDLDQRFVNTWIDAGGDVEMEVLTSKFALVLANIMGSAATLTQISTTTAYQLSTVYGAPDAQNYLSIQALVPDVATVIHQENFHGCKITKAAFSAERGGLLMATLTIDSQYVETSTAAGVPAFATTTFPFNGGTNNVGTGSGGMNFKVGAVGAEANLDGVKKFTLDIERTLKVDRIYMGASAYKEEPVTSGITKISGTMDIDLLSTAQKAQVVDLMHSQTGISIIADFLGPTIGASGHVNELLINITNARIVSGATPELDGPDVVTATINYEAKINSANNSPLTAILTTGDTVF